LAPTTGTSASTAIRGPDTREAIRADTSSRPDETRILTAGYSGNGKPRPRTRTSVHPYCNGSRVASGNRVNPCARALRGHSPMAMPTHPGCPRPGKRWGIHCAAREIPDNNPFYENFTLTTGGKPWMKATTGINMFYGSALSVGEWQSIAKGRGRGYGGTAFGKLRSRNAGSRVRCGQVPRIRQFGLLQQTIRASGATDVGAVLGPMAPPHVGDRPRWFRPRVRLPSAARSLGNRQRPRP